MRPRSDSDTSDREGNTSAMYVRPNSDVDSDEEPLKSAPPADLDVSQIEEHVLEAISASNPRSASSRPAGRLYDTSTRSLGDSKPSGVCYTKLTKGSCTKPDCTFVHSNEAILRELAQLADAWKNGTFAPPAASVPREIAPRRPPSGASAEHVLS